MSRGGRRKRETVKEEAERDWIRERDKREDPSAEISGTLKAVTHVTIRSEVDTSSPVL